MPGYKVPASDHGWSYDADADRTCCEYPAGAHEANASETHASPYTKAYTENLVAALQRTRAELKTMIAVLVDEKDAETDDLTEDDIKRWQAEAGRMAEMMHRMVGSITDDLMA